MTEAGTRRREFAVTPPPAYAGILMAALLVVPAGMLLVALVRSTATGQAQYLNFGIGLAVIAGVAVMTTIGLVRRRVALEEGRLRVQAGLFSQTVAAGELDLERARVVDLAERTELRPAVRMWGMSLPGYHAGHFRLRGKLGKAFCLVTDRQRVLWLPRREGSAQLLLSIEQPQLLLEALKAARA